MDSAWDFFRFFFWGKLSPGCFLVFVAAGGGDPRGDPGGGGGGGGG